MVKLLPGTSKILRSIPGLYRFLFFSFLHFFFFSFSFRFRYNSFDMFLYTIFRLILQIFFSACFKVHKRLYVARPARLYSCRINIGHYSNEVTNLEIKINQFYDCNLTFQMDKTRIYSWILINLSTFFCPFFELNSLLVLYSEIIIILKILLI